ncbi:glycosyltransferase family 2 protein [Pontibacter sp. HJ8]
MSLPHTKISVITCLFNVEKYLQEAIESVLNQSYPHWELLLVDDGSTDASTGIAQRYATSHPDQIIYCQHPGHINKGLSASRNLGLAKASGELITFLDADDVWQPNYLEAQLLLMQEKQVSVICEATEYWYKWDNPQKENQVVYIGTEQDRLYNPPQLMLHLYPLGKGAAPCMCGIILKKELLHKLGGFEDAFRGMYEDQVFLSKLYLSEPIYISSRYNNLYRQRPDSLVGSSQQTGEYHLVRQRYLKWLDQYMQAQHLAHAEVDQLLQKAIKPYQVSFWQRLRRKIRHTLKQSFKKWFPGHLKRIIKYNFKVK